MEILRKKHKTRDLSAERSEEPHEWLSSRLNTAEERFSELEYISQTEKRARMKTKTKKQSPRMSKDIGQL